MNGTETPAEGAAAFALCGLRLEPQGISPGPAEATITITDNHGYFFGQLDWDAGDAQFRTRGAWPWATSGSCYPAWLDTC